MHLGPDDVLVAAKVGVPSRLDGKQVADLVDDAEARIRAAVPAARLIYLEPDVRRDDRGRGVGSSHGSTTAPQRKYPMTEHVIADLALAEAGRHQIRLAEVEMPGLMALREEFGERSRSRAPASLDRCT